VEVHVWRLRLDTPEHPYEWLLSGEELERAERFRFPKDRAHYIVARASLRLLLAGYLGGDARRLSFEYGPHGKPRLSEPGAPDLRFNLTHSNGRALIAVALAREVGVDLEYVRREVTEDAIARRFFSTPEVRSLESLLPAEQTPAFFRCWTSKEAYLKARGDGIFYGLHHFTVSLLPHQPPALLANSKHPEEVDRWRLEAVDVWPEFAACVAAEGSDWSLLTFDIPTSE